MQPSTTGGEPQPFKHGIDFALPGQASHLMILQAEGLIRNEGDRTVLATFSSAFRFPKSESAVEGVEWGHREARKCSIAPGETIKFCVEGELSVEQWVAEQRLAGIEAEISLDDTLDDGVIDTWPIELGGQPLGQVKGKTNVWAIPQIGLQPGLRMPPIYATVSPRRRTYWRPKERDVKL